MQNNEYEAPSGGRSSSARLSAPAAPSLLPFEKSAAGVEYFAISRSALVRTGLLFIPLFFQTTLFRLLEFSFLQRRTIAALDVLLWENAPVPALLVMFIIGGYFFFRSRRPRLPVFWPLLSAAVALALLFGLAAAVTPWWIAEWLSLKAFSYLRPDLIFLLALSLAVFLLLSYTTGWIRRAIAGAAHLIVLLLLLLSGITFGYFLTTGAPGDWHLISYFLRHAGDLAFLVASEMDAGKLVLLLVPPTVIFLPFFIERRPAVRTWIEAGPEIPPFSHSWQPLCNTAPFFLLLLLPPHVDASYDVGGGSYFALLKEMATPDGHALELVSGLTPDAPPFNARALRLVATDSTQALNVVFIMLESVRSRSTTVYNPDLPTTPFLDSLSRHALVADQMFAVVPYTNKSIPSLFAGIYASMNRDLLVAEPGGLPGIGLPDLLRPYGYRSAFFTPATFEFERKDIILDNLGFDTMQGDGNYPTEGFYPKEYFGYEDRIMMDASLSWIDETLRTGQPFFLTYLTLTAHHPYDLPPWFETRTYPGAEEELNKYYNAIRYTDDFVRDLFTAFEARGLMDNTAFVIIGDHGEAFGEHRLFLHGDVIWDEALQVPALLYQPRLFPEGRRITGFRQHIDWLPTLADVLGLRLEGGSLPGVSLLRPVPEDRPLFHTNLNSNVAMSLRKDSLKFVYYHRRRPMQVFNIFSDPMERNDVAPLIPQDIRRAAELDLILWRKGVAQIYQE